MKNVFYIYPILRKAGLRKHTLFYGNLTILVSLSCPDSENIPYLIKSHPVLGKLAFQNRPCGTAHPRMVICGSGPRLVKICFSQRLSDIFQQKRHVQVMNNSQCVSAFYRLFKETHRQENRLIPSEFMKVSPSRNAAVQLWCREKHPKNVACFVFKKSRINSRIPRLTRDKEVVD